jgi:UDP-N-acetylmuramate dehydrogenase
MLEKINIAAALPGDLRFDEPMSAHTTFRVGGPADAWFRPTGPSAAARAAALAARCREAGLPLFILGGGANLVVADRGIRGLVLDTGGFSGRTLSAAPAAGAGAGEAARAAVLRAEAGAAADELADWCAVRGLGGLDFLAGMPGTVGGAVWMNARCYGSDVASILVDVEAADAAGVVRTLPYVAAEWGYKRSPFQAGGAFILAARFRLAPRDPAELAAAMAGHRADREAKGHFRLPSAGSAFKNDYSYGQPTGKIVDELGLRGFAVGGAQVAPWHGNIVVNAGGASAADVKALVDEVAALVLAARGLALEPEILFVGDW